MKDKSRANENYPEIKEYIFLKCDFTAEELKEISSQLAREAANMAEAEENKKAATAQFAEKIASAKARVASLARQVNQGYEMRNVECRVLLDKPKRGLVQVVRADTGEIVKERPMSDSEKQGSLPLGGRVQEVLNTVADEINSGAFDTKRSKVAAEVL